MEKLRSELVSATETAQKLFGAAVRVQHTQENEKVMDPMVELQLRIVQLDRQEESLQRQLQRFKLSNEELENALEQKDLLNARLNSENQRLREVI